MKKPDILNSVDHQTEKDANSRKAAAVAKLALLLLVLIGIPLFLFLRYGDDLFSKDSAYRIIAFLDGNRSIAAMLVIAIQALQVIICILPGQPIQFASSYMFGVPIALLFSLIGAVIGVFISFYIARLLGMEAVELLFGKEKVQDYRKKLNSGKGYLLVFLIYLIPGIPKDLVSYVAGISGMKLRPFIILSTAGRIPGMMGSLLAGHFFSQGNYAAIAVTSLIIVIICLICIVFRKRITAYLDELEAADEKKEIIENGKR